MVAQKIELISSEWPLVADSRHVRYRRIYRRMMWMTKYQPEWLGMRGFTMIEL
jgi:hypothetical protein